MKQNANDSVSVAELRETLRELMRGRAEHRQAYDAGQLKLIPACMQPACMRQKALN